MKEKNSTSQQLAVERYKFILDKIKYLDGIHNSSFSYLQKSTILMTTSITGVLLALIEGKIELKTANLAIASAGLISSIIILFLILTSLAVIFSWLDYREEEVELLEKVECDIGRKKPIIGFKKVMRWSETHLIILLSVMLVISLIVFLNPELVTSMTI
ncbi:hypothetical protein [Grimontia sp. SpTr1]|uniref:hypothetical protein n=1 Tax=Grimontia sp. SpTr1 TaxID=2995319 RepID=UPI00248BB4C0|nr:hypothetical protein [Grimontia sp. SpTr1]